MGSKGSWTIRGRPFLYHLIAYSNFQTTSWTFCSFFKRYILQIAGCFLKIDRDINKTFGVTIVPPDINVLIDTHVNNNWCTVDICVFVYLCFSMLISLIFSADFLFAYFWFLFPNLWNYLRCWSFLLLNYFYLEYFLLLNVNFLILID